MKTHIHASLIGATIGLLLLCDCAPSFPYDERFDIERRAPEAMQPNSIDHDIMPFDDVDEDQDSQLPSDYFREEKRHLCRKYFIYNPVRGRCMPTLMALKQGRKGA